MVREDINLTREVKQQLDRIIQREREKDRAGDCRLRSRSSIVEMILRKGIRAWENENQHQDIE